MGKHDNDKKAATVAAKLINQGRLEEAKRAIATMHPDTRKALADRIQKALDARKTTKSDLDTKTALQSRLRKRW